MAIVHDNPSCGDDRPRRFTAQSEPAVWSDVLPTDLPVDMLLPRLAGATESSPGRWSALCPAHPDTRASLSVCETDDAVLLIHCHAGCTAEAVVQAVGLRLNHLYPDAYARWNADRQGRHRGMPTRTANPVGGPASTDLTREATAAYQTAVESGALTDLAAHLGVAESALHQFGVGITFRGSQQFWVFPERDHHRQVVGLLFRHVGNHQKICRPGGRRGVYLPSTQPRPAPDVPLFLLEGATDTLAVLSRGCPAIGRPAAAPTAAVMSDLLQWLAENPAVWAGRRIVVVGDNDPAGRDGAIATAGLLMAAVPSVTVVYPPPPSMMFATWSPPGCSIPPGRPRNPSTPHEPHHKSD